MFILILTACFQTGAAEASCAHETYGGFDSFADCSEMINPLRELVQENANETRVKLLFAAGRCAKTGDA